MASSLVLLLYIYQSSKLNCFARPKSIDVFLITEEKGTKTSFSIHDTRSQKYGMSGWISQKWAVKSRMDSQIFTELLVVFWAGQMGALSDIYVLIANKFCNQKKKWLDQIIMIQPSFSSLIWLCLIERIYEYVNKIKSLSIYLFCCKCNLFRLKKCITYWFIRLKKCNQEGALRKIFAYSLFHSNPR